MKVRDLNEAVKLKSQLETIDSLRMSALNPEHVRIGIYNPDTGQWEDVLTNTKSSSEEFEQLKDPILRVLGVKRSTIVGKLRALGVEF